MVTMVVFKLLFLAAVFLTAQVSCENSLAFVIDDTYSLYEDIKQVKEASHSIIDLISKERPGEFKDYVLVTFNHEDVTLKKKTRDTKELSEAINAIQVHSKKKDSCSEKALSGVIQALNESQDGSLLYVFTDASASDFGQFDEVKTLCETKKSQIFFVVSGHCGDISSQRYQVYRKIAAACKGQVITIDKDDIKEVPKYFKEIINGKRAVIESTVAPASTYRWSNLDFEINDLIESPIIVASGIDIDLTIFNAKNILIKRGKRIIWTKNFKAFQMARSRAGVYTAKVKGLSKIDVTVLARTNFTFEFGFSNDNQTSLEAAYPRPFTDIKTHLLVFVKDPEGSAEVQGVELHSERGNVTKPLVLVKDNVYATEKFNSTDKPFQIKVVAKAKKTGKTVRSSAKSLVEPIQPTSVELLQVKRDSPIDLQCRIPGNKTKSQITWYTKESEAEDFSLLSGQTKELLHVTKAKTNGYYKCVARTTEGYEQYNAKLEIQVRPQFLYPPPLITVNEGKPVTIECKLFEGSPRPDITWQYKDVNGTTFTIIKDHQGETLNFTEVKIKDSGDYQCIANSSNSTQGIDVKVTRLLVTVAPQIFKRGFNFTIKDGTTIDVPCRILKGTPKPVITWYSKRQGKDDFEEIADEEKEVLHLDKAKISKLYKCVATNAGGTDEHIVNVVVEAPPEFMDTRTNITIKEGKPATINCKLSKGNEPLERSWESKPKGSTAFTVLKHGGEELHFPAADSSHAKFYKCVAENSEGRAEKITELIIQAAPVIEYSAPNKTALEGESVILECRIKKAYPVPAVTWFYKGPEKTEFLNISKTSQILTLANVQVKHTGQYKCVVENDVGWAEQTYQLVVNAPPRIVFTPPNSRQVFAVEGDAAVRLSCDAVGHPAPNITWLVDNKVVGLDKCKLSVDKGPCQSVQPRWYYDSARKECLYFTFGGCGGNENNFKSKEECQGECVLPASTPVEATAPTDKCHLKAEKGPCLSSQKKWYYDSDLNICLDFTYGGCRGNENRFDTVGACISKCVKAPAPIEQIYVDGNALIIQHPLEANSSKHHSYVCRATNDVGRDSQTYDVVISDHIQFEIKNETYALLDKPYDIKCALALTGSSSVKWYKNSKLIQGATGQVLHFDSPKESDDGNYTCRVTDLTQSASHTVQVKFGLPPTRNQTLYNVEWNGRTKEIDCYSSQYPEGEYKWSYNGGETGWSERFLSINNWGEYSCSVTNPLGSFKVVFKVTTPDKDCRVPESLFTSENAPLVLSSSFSWPSLSTIGDYYTVPRAEKLQLVCQDSSNLRSDEATCYEDDSFLVDGRLRKITDLMCSKAVKPKTKRTSTSCLGKNTELVKVGFFVNNFTEVYESCVDMMNFAPLYTKMVTIPVERALVDNSAKKPCNDDSKCCYEPRQLVNKVDVSFGPAKSAVILSNFLNTVQYCRVKNDFDWDNVEMISRSNVQYTVWTGVAQYMRVSGLKAPRYLWKVLRFFNGSELETIVIIHENVAIPGPKLCEGVCGQRTVLFEPAGQRTYCCSLDDLRNKLGVDINLDI